jgi:hypothetical protein
MQGREVFLNTPVTSLTSQTTSGRKFVEYAVMYGHRYAGLSAVLYGYETWLFLFCSWGETESTWYCGSYWPIVPAPDDR